MNRLRFSCACAAAGFSLIFLPAPAPAGPAPTAPTAAADTPAVAVVRHFLDARAAGRFDEAYKLLAFDPAQSLSEKDFAGGTPLPPDAARRLPAPVFGLMVLLGDGRGTQKYTFTALGPDPADPRVVLVRAAPPADAVDAPAVTLRLLTKRAAGGALLVDASGSVARAVPKEPLRMRALSQNNMKQLALAIIEYQQDHDELMPDADKWVDEIMPYVKDKAPFRDPFAPAGSAYGYAFNRALSHKSLAVIEAPATTVLLFESTKSVKNASDLGESIPHPGRDEGGTDYVLVDAHAKWFKDGAKPSFKLSGK